MLRWRCVEVEVYGGVLRLRWRCFEMEVCWRWRYVEMEVEVC